MKWIPCSLMAALMMCGSVFANNDAPSASAHPDTKADGWKDLFAADLSNASFTPEVWTNQDGVLTASQDKAIWTTVKYKNYILDLEFKTADGTNSGVIVHCSDPKNWIPNSVEIQIADDFSPKWSTKDKTMQCAAIFGRLPASKSMVKKPGEWNRFTITCKNRMIQVMLNGELVTVMNMDLWTDPKKNPDGSAIPPWLSKPAAQLENEGYIGLQGKHAAASIWFRNLRIKALE